MFYQQDLAVCFSHAINTTLPKPDLTQLNYIGKAIIGQEPVYHWYLSIPSQVRPFPCLLLTVDSLHALSPLAPSPCAKPCSRFISRAHARAQNATFQYYDDQTSREPVRMDFAQGPTAAGTWSAAPSRRLPSRAHPHPQELHGVRR